MYMYTYIHIVLQLNPTGKSKHTAFRTHPINIPDLVPTMDSFCGGWAVL